MFENVKFGFYSAKMVNCLKSVVKVEGNENAQLRLQLLRDSLLAGRKALSFQSPGISQQMRSDLVDKITVVQGVYQGEMILQMPKEDRELLISILESSMSIGSLVVGDCPIERLIGAFDIARDRLDKGKEVLGIIYKGDHVPVPLRHIMYPFLSGETTQEETEKRLTECSVKLRRWMVELYPGKPAHS